MLDFKDAKDRFAAAAAIFSESTTTVGKLRSVKTILSGINPKLDALLVEYDRRLASLQHLEAGEIVQLAAAEGMPESTEEEKKRKAAVLLLLKSWGELKGEIARVSAEMENAKQSGASQTSLWSNIFKAAKGPLALVTVVAVGIAALNATSVDIEIKNDGCGTLGVQSSVPVSIPGLKLPNEAIASGESALATIPPLTLEIDGTQAGALHITSFGFNLSFQLSGVRDVTLNGTSLVGTKRTVNLGEQKTHTLVLTCR